MGLCLSSLARRLKRYILPLALLCLPWPFLALLKTRVALAAKTAAVTILFLIAALLITTEKRLLLQAALMTIFVGLTLIVFYGNRGFYLAVLSCFGLLSWSAIDRLFFGFAASTITPSWAILGQTLALGAI